MDWNNAASATSFSTRKADLMTTQRNLAVLENVLKQLLTDDFASLESVSLEPSGTLDAELQLFSLQDSWSKGLSLRPDFLQVKLDRARQLLLLLPLGGVRGDLP